MAKETKETKVIVTEAGFDGIIGNVQSKIVSKVPMIEIKIRLPFDHEEFANLGYMHANIGRLHVLLRHELEQTELDLEGDEGPALFETTTNGTE